MNDEVTRFIQFCMHLEKVGYLRRFITIAQLREVIDGFIEEEGAEKHPPIED